MKKFITKFSQLIVLFTFLEIIYLLLRNNPLIVSPIAILKNTCNILLTKECYICIFNTYKKILLGLAFSCIIGSLLAFFSAKAKAIKFIADPIMKVIKITPIVSFIIFALIFIKNTLIVTIISMVMTLPVFYYNIYNGIKNIDKKILDMAKVYKFSYKKKLFNIYIPSTFQNFVSSIQSGIGYSIKAGITAEILVLTNQSIGFKLYEAKVYLDTLQLMSYTIIIVVTSLIIEYLIIEFLNTLKKLSGVVTNDKVNEHK